MNSQGAARTPRGPPELPGGCPNSQGAMQTPKGQPELPRDSANSQGATQTPRGCTASHGSTFRVGVRVELVVTKFWVCGCLFIE